MQDDSIPSDFQKWVKPIVLIIVIFIIGFSIPVFLKNYLTQKAQEKGLAPTIMPSPATKLSGPYYQFAPEQVTLAPGETTLVKVFINTDKKAIEAFDFIATYDPEIVTVTAVDPSPLFPSYPAIELGEGIITVGGNIGADKQSFSVTDTLLVITLEGKIKGETRLKLDKDKSTIASKGENILQDSNSIKVTVK